MRGIARVDDDGVHFRTIGCAVLHAAHPFPIFCIVIYVREWRPSEATIGRTEQALRRSTRVPDIRFANVARREPEGVVHRTTGFAVFGRRECGRLWYFFPSFT